MLIDKSFSRVLVIIQLLIGLSIVPTKRAKESVGEGETGKKTKVTQHEGGQSVSEKSQVTRTSKNLFEKSGSRFSDDGI